MSKEKIVKSAINHNGVIYEGIRHGTGDFVFYDRGNKLVKRVYL